MYSIYNVIQSVAKLGDTTLTHILSVPSRAWSAWGSSQAELTKSAAKWMGRRQDTRSMRRSERTRYIMILYDIIIFHGIPIL